MSVSTTAPLPISCEGAAIIGSRSRCTSGTKAGSAAVAWSSVSQRFIYVQLTPAGRRLQDQARPIVQQIVADHFGRHLSDEDLATLRDALARVARASRAAEGAASL